MVGASRKPPCSVIIIIIIIINFHSLHSACHHPNNKYSLQLLYDNTILSIIKLF